MYKAFAENETLKLKKISLRLLELTIDQGDRGGVGNLRSRSLFMLLAQLACFFLRTSGLPLTPTDGVSRIFSLTPFRNRESDSPWLRCTSLLRALIQDSSPTEPPQLKLKYFLCYYPNPCAFILVQMVCLYPPTDGVAKIFSLTPCRNQESDSRWLHCTYVLRDLNSGHFTN